MKEQQLFEAMGQIDPRHVAAAQRRRGRAGARERKEYVVAPEKDGGFHRWMIPVACALMAAVLVTVIPCFYKGGAEPLLSIAVSDTTGETLQSEPERVIMDEPPSYVMVFKSVEEYQRLRAAVDLPDDQLRSVLRDGDYSPVDGGIDTRERLQDFVADTQLLPIPSLPGETLQRMTVVEYNSVAVFDYPGFTMEITKEPDKERTQWEISSLGLIWEYEGEYSLYLGSENATSSVCYLDLLMNAEDYLVRISTETDDPKGFIDDLEQLSFQFPETVSVGRPEGEYGSTMDGFEWKFAEQTGILTFLPLRENARVGGYMIYTEAPWYAHADKITAVVVEEGIVGLEPRSITELPNLQKVDLPESLVSIGDQVFSGCALYTLELPAAVTDIGMGVAAECEQLRTVVVEAWQPQIGQEFLHNCPALEKITMKSPSGYWQQVVLPANPHLVDVTVDCALEDGYDPATLYDENGVLWSYQPETGSLSIQGSGVVALPPAGILRVWEQVQTVTLSEGITAMAGGLADMVSLRSVSLPATLEAMPSLSGCKELEMITVPERIKELPSMAFNGCARLKTVILPEGLEKIESMAFGGCSALEYISIPDGVSWIDQAAFWACLSLKEIHLPESLRRLKAGTFMECVQLQTVTLPAGLADIEGHCFEGCTSLKTLRFEGTQAQWDKLYSHCAEVFPEGVTVEVSVQPTENPAGESPRSLPILWILVSAAAVAAVLVAVTVIAVKKRGKKA